MLAVTGGGTTAISDLLAVPGASRTLLEATVPYDSQALADYIQRTPEQSASASTARQLAMSAYQRARQLTGAGDDVVGIGCTAALTTDRSRRGTDRCFIAAQTAKRTMIDFIAFNNAHSETSRAQQERACSDAVINLLARVAGVTDGPLSLPIGNIETDHVAAPLAWQALLAGINASTLNELATPSPVKLLFPGSFNPLHQGHQDMVRIAEDISGELAVLEISTFNVDKPPIDYIEMRDREQTIGQRYPLVFTNAPTFVSKARLFPGVMFVVGVDTITRIGDSRYYQTAGTDPEQNLREGLDALTESNCRFLVFGRKVDSRFESLTSVKIPVALRNLCTGIPEDRFRKDVSSSEIRHQS